MARLHTAGFESGYPKTPKAYDGESNNVGTGDSENDHVMVGTVTYQTTTARNFGRAMACAPSAGNFTQLDGPPLTASRAYFARFYFRTDDVTPSAAIGLQVWNWRINAIVVADLTLTQASTIICRDANGATVGTSAAISANTWYRLETKIVVPAAGNGVLEARIDGVEFANSQSVDVNNALTPATHRVGHISPTTESQSTIFIDDLAINDDQGANQNSWPGPGNVTFCPPTSDNTKGTGWVAGAGGATLYTAVDNIPPVGLAVPTDASQVKNATSTTNSVYSANCASIALIGAPANAIISLAQGLARVSTDSATGTNLMEIESFTPAISAVSVDAEFGTVAADETSATPGWKTGRTAVSYNPSMTYTTSPVVGVRKVTAATRNHYADQIGLLVEWFTPVTGAAALTGTGSSTVAGDVSGGFATVTGAAALTGTGSATIAGTRTRLGAASLTGTGTSTVAGAHTGVGAAALTGTGSSTTAGVRTRFAAASLTGTGTSTTAATRKRFGAAALTGTGSSTVVGVVDGVNAANLTGTGSLTVSAYVTKSGIAALTGTGTSTVAGVRKRTGAASLTGTSSSTVAGTRGHVTSAALTAQGSAQIAALLNSYAQASLTGGGVLVADGYKSTTAAAELLATGLLTATASIDPWTYGGQGGTATYGGDPDWSYGAATTSTYTADPDWTYGGTANPTYTYGG